MKNVSADFLYYQATDELLIARQRNWFTILFTRAM